MQLDENVERRRLRTETLTEELLIELKAIGSGRDRCCTSNVNVVVQVATLRPSSETTFGGCLCVLFELEDHLLSYWIYSRAGIFSFLYIRLVMSHPL